MQIKGEQKYDPEDLWECSWQDGEYGAAGTLDECIYMISNYILRNLTQPNAVKQKLKYVKYQCLTVGETSGKDNWWAIWYRGRID